MKEEFVSYSQARLLKECGFDWECIYYYYGEHKYEGCNGPENYNNPYVFPNFCSAPTLAFAQKWLRDVHEISIEPISNIVGQWNVNVCTIGVCGEILWSKIGLENYESALATGLDAALELIKQK